MYISWFLIGIIYNLLYCYLYADIIEEKNWKPNIKVLGICTIVSMLNCFIVYKGYIIRPIATNISFIIILYVCMKSSFSKMIITILQLDIIFMLGEILFTSIFLQSGIISQTFATKSAIGLCITNILIFILSTLIYKIPKVRKTINNITKWYSEKKLLHIISLSIIAIVAIGVIAYQNFGNDITRSYMLVINIFLICVIVFIIGYLREKANNGKLIVQYDNMLEYVKTYEKLLNEKAKTLHEHKNQLIILKDMISTTNKKAIRYIDELLDIQSTSTDLEWLNEFSYIQQTGIKGLLHYKISQMKQQNIMTYIHIDEQLAQKSKWKICEKYLTDVSRIIGVYIDNAIEAAMTATKKYIIIDIELQDEDIVFSFSNTFSGQIDINKIDIEGFSTKGKNKGYGLALVKDILRKNKYLEQKREMNGIYYVQKLIIKHEKNG